MTVFLAYGDRRARACIAATAEQGRNDNPDLQGDSAVSCSKIWHPIFVLSVAMIVGPCQTCSPGRWQPKTATNRVVPISKVLSDYLDRYHCPPSDGNWLFPSPQGMRWDPDNLSAALRRLNAPHGLPWTCAHYRHTFGSQLAQKGVSLYKISTLMGNSPEICRRHYAALVPETMVDDVEFAQQ